MSEIDYHVYMQKVDKNGQPLENTERDIELSFEGLKYSMAEGLNDVGKAKNIYAETYADSDKTRVYIPQKIEHEATEVLLTLFFIGNSRQQVYDSFNEYIMDGFHTFRDTVRNKVILFYVGNVVKINESKYCGSTPYLKVVYSLSNVYGQAFNKGSEPWL